MKHFLLMTLALFIIGATISNAQFRSEKGVQVLVKGKVTDEFTGAPAGVTMEIRDSEDKRIKINSNSITGNFEQILTAGESYTVIFTHFDIIRKTEMFKVKEADKYIEYKIDFKVKKLQVGLELFKEDFFSQGSAEAKGEIGKFMQELSEIMKFNRSVKFEFRVNAHDTFSEPRTYQVEVEKPASKRKKNQKPEFKTVTDPAPDPAAIKALVDERAQAVENALAPLKTYSNRVNIGKDYSPAPVAESANPELNPDFKVIVAEIENIFK